jgi:hypothetical protein
MAQPHPPRERFRKSTPEFRGLVYVAPRTRSGGYVQTRYNCLCGCNGKLLLMFEKGTTCQFRLSQGPATVEPQ